MASEFSDVSVLQRRERFLAGEVAADAALRDDILASWRRSADFGVRPDRFEVPQQPDLEGDGQLQRAAGPVFDHVAEDLPATNVALLLTNEQAEVLDRRVADRTILGHLDRVLLAPSFCYSEGAVGTNAIGTALEVHRPSVVFGGEHFAEVLTALACAAVPIEDPGTGRTLGVVNVTSEAKDASALMLPFVRRIAREINERLIDGTLVEQRILRERFLRAKRWAKGPLVSLGEDSIMTNRAAAEIVGPTDHALLSEWAERELRGDRRASELSLSNGMSVFAHLEPVTDGTEVVGALIRLTAAAPPDVIGGRARSPSGRHRQRFGWASLTDTERKIVDLIAEGLTNAEAGRRLFLSHHTVEYHLKSIYRKLEIRTRLQLAVLVMERATTLT